MAAAPKTTKEIYDRLSEKLGDAVFEYTEADKGWKDPGCKVKPERLVDVARFLRDDPELDCDFLVNLTAVDWVKQNILQVVYHLYSYTHRHSFVLKVDLPRAKPEVASMVSVWPTADWNEREQFDLLGVTFLGHPDLRRLLMPDDWEGFPMRKDYKEAAEYRGMPTTRPSPIELLSLYDKQEGNLKKKPEPAKEGGK
jgi:NADH-quinone oxidoreductase subunit C